LLCNWCVRGNTSSEFLYSKKGLISFGCWTTHLQSLYLIVFNAKEEEENYWVKLNKETLAYFWNKFEDDGKYKSCCIGELALLFMLLFGKMLLIIGLENMKKCFNYLVCHMILRNKK
jgi:hypothetical protein